MQTRLTASLFVATLLFIGGGCGAPATAPADTESDEVNLEVSMDEGSEGSMEEGSEGAMMEEGSEDAMMEGEDGWETYTNAAFNFSFDFPTKGKYAPTWEVNFVLAEELAEGCFGGEGYEHTSMQVGDVEFCRSVSVVGDDVTEVTDYYTTAVDEQPVVLAFTKSSEDIFEFSWEEHRAHLEEIVGTFALATE